MKKICILITITIVTFLLTAQTNFKVMTYNALIFPSEHGPERLQYFQTIFNEVDPDILLLQEIENTYGAMDMLDLLNSNGEYYARSTFVSNGDSSNMFYYKTARVSLTSQDEINCWPRDISEYFILIDDEPLYIYSCHLKASSGADNEQHRLNSVTNLREHIEQKPFGTEFIIVGDMNFYDDNEPAYEKFMANETNNIGRAKDLTDLVGNWHDNSSYAEIHTQSPRVSNFWGGVGGGLDDRFDFMLTSFNLNNGSGVEYLEGSMHPYGNDGNHFNQSINDGYNNAVPANIADALYYASDHLPVVGEFFVIDEVITMISPNGGEDWFSGENHQILWETDEPAENVTITLLNSGNTVETLATDVSNSGSFDWIVTDELPSSNGYKIKIHLTENDTSFDESDLSFSINGSGNSDAFFISEYIEGSSYNKALELFNGTGNSINLNNYTLKKQTNGAGEFGSDFELSGTLENNEVYVVCHSSATEDILTIADATSSVCNFNGNDAMGLFFNNELIDLVGIIDSSENWGKDMTLVRKSIVAQPNEYYDTEEWDEYSMDTFTYLGDHEFSPVSIDTENITTSTISIYNYPNPFNPSTTIYFTSTENAENSKLIIYNLKGQKIRQYSILHNQSSVIWNGKDENGKPVSSGIYFYQLQSAEMYSMGKMILLQ
ncbi:MAG: lamin tail domain-containing protein [Candidatus Cloacimonetes bacterium]|nr:lamin tail domain-containing protein [Candidatus Cloacimonadota bacterium]